jgi:hypothetical protein
VRSGGKRCGLGEVRHFSGVRHSVVGYVTVAAWISNSQYCRQLYRLSPAVLCSCTAVDSTATTSDCTSAYSTILQRSCLRF